MKKYLICYLGLTTTLIVVLIWAGMTKGLAQMNIFNRPSDLKLEALGRMMFFMGIGIVVALLLGALTSIKIAKKRNLKIGFALLIYFSPFIAIGFILLWNPLIKNINIAYQKITAKAVYNFGKYNSPDSRDCSSILSIVFSRDMKSVKLIDSHGYIKSHDLYPFDCDNLNFIYSDYGHRRYIGKEGICEIISKKDQKYYISEMLKKKKS